MAKWAPVIFGALGGASVFALAQIVFGKPPPEPEPIEPLVGPVEGTTSEIENALRERGYVLASWDREPPPVVTEDRQRAFLANLHRIATMMGVPAGHALSAHVPEAQWMIGVVDTRGGSIWWRP